MKLNFCRVSTYLALLLFVCTAFVGSAAAQTATKPDYAALLNSMKWREIGPATMGGRIDDFAVVESDPRIIYAGTAAGGIFKTTNGGTTWTPIFDKQDVPTIGDLALAPSDPSVLYVGTGEPNNRQSSSWGKGVYKSTDAGKTWQYLGLPETQAIGRIVVHPTNPEVVYVAAVGKLWGASPERGVYKSTDGGKTWQQVLKINDDTGVSDIALDPASPNTLYAAAYQRRRTVFGFNGSGPGSALYKTTDGGATWAKLSKGLPYDMPEGATTPPNAATLETGRIAVDIYRKNSSIVYMTIEHANGGVFRSNDKGETWQKMSDTQPRPMYFSQIRIDPNNDLRLWMAGVPLFYSEDGGKTFTNSRGNSIHVDYHAIWINPNNSDHALAGTDGGVHQTWDGGKSWDFIDNLAIGQFYEIGVDMQSPYNICGGLQDNNTWCGPSRTFNSRGIDNEDWYTVGGGDGFYAQVDPLEPHIVYAESQDGNLVRRNTKTGEAILIRPVPAEGEKAYRFNWNSPIVISKYDNKTIYYAGNFVFKSNDRGDTWTRISPELTTAQDRNTMPIMGKVPDKDSRSRHDGVQQWPTISTLSESPASAETLWAGTDDGQLQVTRDGGKTWKNVFEKLPDAPKGTYVSRVVPSVTGAGVAFVTLDGHRSNDFKQYVYVTENFGDSWKSLAGGLPQDGGTISVLREHAKNPKLLFLGTEYGAYASFDRGAKWHKVKSNFPASVPVDDIVIHPRENDLIFGTHGRSIWILDDISALAELNDAILDSDAHLFDLRAAMMWRTWNNTGSTGDKKFFGANPPPGAWLSFYFKNKPTDKDRLTLVISDAAGQTVRTINCNPPRPSGTAAGATQGGGGGFFGGGGSQCTLQQGFNRFAWDFRGDSLMLPGGAGQGGGGPFGGGGIPGLRVEPGTYNVKLSYNSKDVTKQLTVQEDERITLTPEQRAARREALTKLRQLSVQAALAQFTIVTLRTAVNNEIEAWKRPNAPRVPDNVKQKAEELLKKIDAAYPNWGTPPSEQSTASQAGPPLVERPTPLLQRAIFLGFGMEGYAAPVTAAQTEQINILAQKIPEAAAVVRQLAQEELPALNKLINEANVPHIVIPTGPPTPPRPPQEDDN